MTTIAQLNETTRMFVDDNPDFVDDNPDFVDDNPDFVLDFVADEGSIERAVETGDHNFIGMLCIMHIDNPQDGFDISLTKGLISAIRGKKMEIIEKLLDFQSDLDSSVEIDTPKVRTTPWAMACAVKDYDIIHTLINRRGFPDYALVSAAAMADNHRVIDLLFNPQDHGIEMCENMTLCHKLMLAQCPLKTILLDCHETNLKAIQDHFTD